jgi:hypothetical protein
MTHSNAGEVANPKRPKLPRRDWLLLPLLSLVTIFLIAISSEGIARHAFPGPQLWFNNCFISNNPSTGLLAIPNAVCSEEGLETKLVEHRFNGCGHRTDLPCGPKPPGVFRIVMLGSSFSMGYRVPDDEAFATLLPRDLSKETGQNIELYNESMMYETSHIVPLRFNEALQVKPDLILWVLTYWDIEYEAPLPPPPEIQKPFLPELAARLKAAVKERSIHGVLYAFLDLIHDRLSSTRTAFMLSHFLGESQSLYLKSFLNEPGPGYLRPTPDAEWVGHLKDFDREVAEVETQSKGAGVPLIITLAPYRGQAAMISMNEWPVGYDPYMLDRELHSIVASHGGTYLDMLPDFRNIPNPERYYFPMDGHLKPDGNALFARLLTKELTSGAIPPLDVNAGNRTEGKREH